VVLASFTMMYDPTHKSDHYYQDRWQLMSSSCASTTSNPNNPIEQVLLWSPLHRWDNSQIISLLRGGVEISYLCTSSLRSFTTPQYLTGRPRRTLSTSYCHHWCLEWVLLGVRCCSYAEVQHFLAFG
jgi:hypothetical protein